MADAKERRGGRHYLGAASGIALRQRVYRTRDYLEVDEIDGYDVVRKRVFFDDVLLVTYHRFMGWSFLVAMGTLAAIFTLIAVATGSGSRDAGLAIFAISALPFLVLFAGRLILKVDAVTVYGKRSRAQIHFPVRKGRAREVYVQLCRAAREHQDRLTRELARQRAAAQPAAIPGEPA